MNFSRTVMLAPLLLLGACAKDSTQNDSTAAAPVHKKLTERVTEDNGYKQDSNGNWVPRSDKRSSFESQGESAYFKKDFNKKEYKTGDYAKKSWWGNKDYDRKTYAGNTDASQFQKGSSMQGQGARETGNKVDLPGAYNTGDYATSTAREAGAKTIAKGSNDMIENRRKVFEQPEITDWHEQRSFTMDRSKGILGH